MNISLQAKLTGAALGGHKQNYLKQQCIICSAGGRENTWETIAKHTLGHSRGGIHKKEIVGRIAMGA